MTWLIRISLVIFMCILYCEGLSKFWHISDHHLDLYYDEYQPKDLVCPSSYGAETTNPGQFGDYKCDSPWSLINSSAYAMARIEPDCQFIIWTGDDVMHTADEDKYLSEEVVISTIQNLTNLLKEVFPDKTVYPSVGNHDFYPKLKLAATGNSIISAMAEMWKDWLTESAYQSFKKNGYYYEYLDGNTEKNLIISLNTMLWYHNNDLVDGSVNSGGQFEWFEELLTTAQAQNQNVYIIGHIPPGAFELAEDGYWLYDDCNKKYIELVVKFYDVIKGQFFGHHHTDTFKLFKNAENKAVSSMFLAPGITPWMTTYPGVVNGANNPGIRLMEYDETTLDLLDYEQYYLNLEEANMNDGDSTEWWTLEYSAKNTYNVDNIQTDALETMAEQLKACADESCPIEDVKVLQTYSFLNSVSYNNATCLKDCQRNHYCAITQVDFEYHKNCIVNWPSSARENSYIATLICACVFVLAIALL